MTLEDSEINNNIAQFGGGIYTGFKSNTVVINSKFNNNDGTLGGSERGEVRSQQKAQVLSQLLIVNSPIIKE